MSTNEHGQPLTPPSSAPEKIGRGRPPRAHQFKPGQSGNPKGRRKGSKNEATLLCEILDETKLTLREGGKTRKITVREAILRRFADIALKGDVKAAAFLLNRYAVMVSGELGQAPISEEDREVIEFFLKKQQAEASNKSA